MADEQTTLPLIRTKLHRPPVTKDHLHRERLLDRLEKNRQRPLTLVSAPAGYGKSTLLSCWLESCDVPSAWVSLDNNDNDLRVFLAYLLAAVQTQFPAAGQKTEALLNSSKLPPLAVMTHSLINELDQIDRSFLLVLDDYHVISDKAVQGLIAELLQHPPGPLHLVLSSRVDPMLPLERFRARGQMTEIRARDLRFSREETKIFLDLLMGVPVDGSTAAVLEQKTEGWVTGLRLSALFLRRRSDLNRVLENLPAESRYVLDYLLAEVLSNQSEEIQQYLLATAILDRFCATLCDAVCVPGSRSLECKMGGQQFIEWLEKSDLFVIPLDEQGRWFRYHHLFQKLLQHQLKHRFEPDEISELQRRASRWFAENNLIDEALQYALAAGDVSAAVHLVEQNRHAPLNEDKWYVLEKWLAQLPDDIVQQRPALLMAKAWVLNFQFALWAIPPLLNAIETLLGGESKEFPEEMDLFNGIFLFWEGQGEHAAELLGRALKRIPAANIGIRNEAEIYFAGSSQIAGRGKRTVQTYRKKFYNETSEGTRKLRLLGALIFIHLLSGELVEAEEATRQLKDMATRTHNVHIEAWTSYLQGIIHYHWNHLETAAHHFSRALENRFALDAGSDIDSYAGLILSYQAMQQPDKARETMARMMEFAQEAGNPASLPLARSTRARLRLLQGDLESAVRWLETTDFSSDTDTLLFWLEVPRITRCRVLVARESEASLAEATEKLRDHLKFSQATHNTPQMIEILLLQTMACQKQGQTDQALASFEHAVTLARPGGYIRPFVNPGEPMADLLRRLLYQGKAADYIGRILTAFDSHESVGGQVAPSPQPELKPWMRNQALAKPLTNRELEILPYLRQGLRNKEIAAKLFVSPETVKKHTSNICRKLNVHNRQQAVAQAHRLGVLKQNR
jgi:LuxR family maltose regulon positive regulatory protein